MSLDPDLSSWADCILLTEISSQVIRFDGDLSTASSLLVSTSIRACPLRNDKICVDGNSDHWIERKKTMKINRNKKGGISLKLTMPIQVKHQGQLPIRGIVN